MIYNYTRNHDVIPDRMYLLLRGYRIRDLIAQDDACYARPVFKALLLGLAALADRGDRRLRERRFGIWAGDYGNHFWTGIPAKMSAGVSALLGRYLEIVPGFEFLEMGTVPFIPLVPVFLYDYGRIGEYGAEEKAGKTYRDSYYDSGVRLEGRVWIPECDLD